MWKAPVGGIPVAAAGREVIPVAAAIQGEAEVTQAVAAVTPVVEATPAAAMVSDHRFFTFTQNKIVFSQLRAGNFFLHGFAFFCTDLPLSHQITADKMQLKIGPGGPQTWIRQEKKMTLVDALVISTHSRDMDELKKKDIYVKRFLANQITRHALTPDKLPLDYKRGGAALGKEE